MVHLDRPLDIVVYGATGFTGKLVAKHLKEHAGHIKLGLGGRSQEKLQQVADELGLKDAEIIAADSSDLEALKKLCKKTKAIITLVGPYAYYGEAVIRAAAETGTHYFDLAGETLWTARMIQKYSDAALRSRAILVPSCGYDSVPSDLAAMLAVRELKRVGGKNAEVGKVSMGAAPKGMLSGGTVHSGMAMAEEGFSNVLALGRNPYVMSPVKGNQTNTGADAWVSREKGLWGGKFIMALHNAAVVRRTWGILQTIQSVEERDGTPPSYGPSFTYKEYLRTPDPVSAFLLSLVMSILGLFILLPPFRWLVKKTVKTGTGPSQKTQDTGKFTHYTTAHSVKDDIIVRVTMRGKGDPGYAWTSACIGESALCVVENYDRLSGLAREGGPLTPVTALGDVLLERLQKIDRINIKTETIRGPSNGGAKDNDKKKK